MLDMMLYTIPPWWQEMARTGGVSELTNFKDTHTDINHNPK
jgi:hypothetical protein